MRKKPKENLKEVNCEEIVKKVDDLERQASQAFRDSTGNDMAHAVGSQAEAEARDLREKHKNCFPQAEEPTGLPQGRELTFRDLNESAKKQEQDNKTWYDSSLYSKLKSMWTTKGDK